ncbi:hypothetical protein ACFXJ8_27200 [Nonomuraea sp. NPDC059194]|uniref:hypothetical protein n=1 Tax=Nonomuraea sp. NPDC059194 TaxID=3346764 RepID=UPI0036A82CCB
MRADGSDASTGLQSAIDAIRTTCTPTAGYTRLSSITMPPGRIVVTRQLALDADYLVLRGAGMARTVLAFRPGTDTRWAGNETVDYTGAGVNASMTDASGSLFLRSTGSGGERLLSRGGTDDLAVTGSGRHIRLYGTSRGTPYGYSLWEFEVYGTTVVNARTGLTNIPVTP